MSAEAIPIEILLMILKNLKGTDAAACRAVCCHWRDAVDYLTDRVWEDFCYRDLWNPKIVKHISNLSYRDLYKSLTLWAKVEEAEEMCPIEPVNNVFWFKLLNNNTVAVLPIDESMYELIDEAIHEMRPVTYSQNIEYYNIHMILISRRTFNFPIFRCDENEHMIALLNANNRNIHVIIKSNESEIVVGEQGQFPSEIFMLLDTELYFMSVQDMMCVARLKVVDGEETVETVELHGLEEEYVIAFARAGDDGVNVLTDEGNIYLYCYLTTELTLRVQFKDDNVSDNIYGELRHFGFQWSDAIIYDWLLATYPEKQLQITKLNRGKNFYIYLYNHVVLLGAYQGAVHVYKRSYYDENGELKTYKLEPDRTIDMNKYTVVDRIGSGSVDVVETLYGHRLLVRYTCRLFCIDLLHKQVNK